MALRWLPVGSALTTGGWTLEPAPLDGCDLPVARWMPAPKSGELEDVTPVPPGPDPPEPVPPDPPEPVPPDPDEFASPLPLPWL